MKSKTYLRSGSSGEDGKQVVDDIALAMACSFTLRFTLNIRHSMHIVALVSFSVSYFIVNNGDGQVEVGIRRFL